MYFQVVKTKTTNGTRWHSRIVGANHEIVFASQNYYERASAIHACKVVQAGAAPAEIYEVDETT